MSQKRPDIIFSASTSGPQGAFCELVISEDHTVYYTHRSHSGERPQTHQLDRRRQAVNSFLWEAEEILITDWDQSRYEGEATDTSWMVLLEKDRRLAKWQGAGAYPPRWQEFRLLIEEFIDGAFGW